MFATNGGIKINDGNGCVLAPMVGSFQCIICHGAIIVKKIVLISFCNAVAVVDTFELRLQVIGAINRVYNEMPVKLMHMQIHTLIAD